MPRNVHNRPSASKIQPMELSGRLEAIRAPTIGKAKKSAHPNCPPMERSTPQLLGTCAERARTNSTTLARKMASQRPASDHASQEARRALIPPTSRSRLLDLSVTTLLYRKIVSRALR